MMGGLVVISVGELVRELREDLLGLAVDDALAPEQLELDLEVAS